MRLRQTGAIALSFLLVLPPLTAGMTTSPIEPIDPTLFRRIDVPREATPETTPPARPISDFPTPARSRPPAVVPETAPEALVDPSSTKPRRGSISGLASWYCRPGASICPRGYSGGMFAAAGPKLRAALCGVQSCTSWRGRTVYVNGRAVKLVDWCQCYWRQGNEKLIDLFWDAWGKTNARGGVKISW